MFLALAVVGVLLLAGVLVAETAAAGHAFFDLPEDEKRMFAEGEPTLGLPAYRPLRSERLAASLGKATPADLKESLDWGPAVPGYGWPGRPPDPNGGRRRAVGSDARVPDITAGSGTPRHAAPRVPGAPGRPANAAAARPRPA